MIIIGIAGGTGSGKTTLAQQLCERLYAANISALLISQDSYYQDRSHLPPGQRGQVNFDHPNAIDFDLLAGQLRELKARRSVEQPVYDFTTHCRTGETTILEPARVLVLEGILIFHWEALRALMDLKVFVDAPDDVRFRRRLERDVRERGRTSEDMKRQYDDTVRPMYEQFVAPSRRYADLTVDGQGDIAASVDAVLLQVKDPLGQQGTGHRQTARRPLQ